MLDRRDILCKNSIINNMEEKNKEIKEFTTNELEEFIIEREIKHLNTDEVKPIPDLFILDSTIVAGDLPEMEIEPQIYRCVKFEEIK